MRAVINLANGFQLQLQNFKSVAGKQKNIIEWQGLAVRSSDLMGVERSQGMRFLTRDFHIGATWTRLENA